MTIEVRCECGAKIKAKDKLAGKKVACPKCKKPLKIPSTEPEVLVAADLAPLDDSPLDPLSGGQSLGDLDLSAAELNAAPLSAVQSDPLGAGQNAAPGASANTLNSRPANKPVAKSEGGMPPALMIAAAVGGGLVLLLVVGGLLAVMMSGPDASAVAVNNDGAQPANAESATGESPKGGAPTTASNNEPDPAANQDYRDIFNDGSSSNAPQDNAFAGNGGAVETATSANSSGFGKPAPLKQTRVDNELKMTLCFVKPGKLELGSRSGTANFPGGFWMGQTEVTRGQWMQLMGTEPWKEAANVEGDNYPANFISWNAATEFCKKLTEKERAAGRIDDTLEYRLPSNSEHLYAYGKSENDPRRAGTIPPNDWGWHKDTSNGQVHEVATKLESHNGLYDLLGNVAEWTADGFWDGRSRATPGINTYHWEGDVPHPEKLQHCLAGGHYSDKWSKYIRDLSLGAGRGAGFRVVLNHALTNTAPPREEPERQWYQLSSFRESRGRNYERIVSVRWKFIQGLERPYRDHYVYIITKHAGEPQFRRYKFTPRPLNWSSGPANGVLAERDEDGPIQVAGFVVGTEEGRGVSGLASEEINPGEKETSKTPTD